MVTLSASRRCRNLNIRSCQAPLFRVELEQAFAALLLDAWVESVRISQHLDGENIKQVSVVTPGSVCLCGTQEPCSGARSINDLKLLDTQGLVHV